MRFLTFDMKLPELLYQELLDACTERACHRTVFAAEAVEVLLAARRLPRVEAGSHGAFTSGMRRRQSTHEDEEFESPADAGKILL